MASIICPFSLQNCCCSTQGAIPKKMKETALCNGTLVLAFLVWQSNNLEHAHNNNGNKKLHAVLILGDAVN